MILNLFASTDVGRVREHNEDNFTLCKDLSSARWSVTFQDSEKATVSDKGTVLVVADGMGGTNAGEIASEVACKSVKDQFTALSSVPSSEKDILAFVKKVVSNAHKAVVDHQMNNVETAGMGTTLVITWILKDTAFVAWAGDSRMYIHRAGNELAPFSDDHSLVWSLVKSGQLTAEEARLHPNSNIITQSLGDPKNTPNPEGKSVRLYKGDRILVCSDGLTGMVSDTDLQKILEQGKSPAETTKTLIKAANDGGGTDNITVILADVTEGLALPPNGGGLPSNSSGGSGGMMKWIIAAVIIIIGGLAAWFLMGKAKDVPAIPYEEVKLPLRDVINPGTDYNFVLTDEYSDLVNKKIDSVITETESHGVRVNGNNIVLSPISSEDSISFVLKVYVGAEHKVYTGSVNFLPEKIVEEVHAKKVDSIIKRESSHQRDGEELPPPPSMEMNQQETPPPDNANAGSSPNITPIHK